jgi:serine protease Do/serine protease DegQ
VIGINTAIVAAGQGIGFAIPIAMAKPVFTQIMQKGSVSRGYMGVTIQPVTEELASSFGLKQARGALVNDVLKNGPADKAGIRQGDVITAFNGTEVKDPSHLQRLVAEQGVGKTARVTVFRDGKSLELGMTLSNADSASRPRGDSGKREQSPNSDLLGLTVEDAEQGVTVVEVERGSAAADAGIRRGDVIVLVNRKKIPSSAEYARIIQQAGRGGSLTVLVRRGDASIYFALRIK